MSITQRSRSKSDNVEVEGALECKDGNTGNTLRIYNRFKRPTLIDSGGIMARFATKGPAPKAFGRQDIFKKGDVVMFRSVLFEKVVTGIISEDSSLVRRWNGKAFYKVEIYKRSRSRPGQPALGKAPILESVDANLMELKPIWELRTSKNTFNKLFVYGKALAMAKWIYLIHTQWHEEWRQKCATSIQRKYRNYKSGLMRAIRTAMLVAARQKREAEEAARLKAIEDEKKRIAFEAYVREVGITPDGKNYFLTKREMKVFLGRREKALARAKFTFQRIWRGEERRVVHLAWDKWMKVDEDTKGHKVYDAKEAWTLSNVQEYRARVLKGHVPHPAHGIKGLRPMASSGTKHRKDGSFRIVSLEQFRKFQANMSGPIDESCWLIKGRLLVGGLPIGMARRDRSGAGAKGTCAASLMSYKISHYFCLCSQEELEEMPEGGFRRDIDRKAKDQARVFRNNLALRKERIPQIAEDLVQIKYKQKMASADRKHEFIPEIESNEKTMAKAVESVDNAKKTLENWPEFPEYHYFPVVGQEGLMEIGELTKLCESVEMQLREGKNCYVFSKTGHGRAGVAGACLLGRLYGYSQDDALIIMQRLHATRADMQSRMGTGQRARMAPIQCPKSHNQRMLVREVLSRNDEIYQGVARCMSPRGNQASAAYKKAVTQSMPPSMEAIGWPDPIPVKSPIFNSPTTTFKGYIYGSYRKWRRGMGVPKYETESKPTWWEVRDKELADARTQRFLEIDKAHAAAVLGLGREGTLPPLARPPADKNRQRAEAKARALARLKRKKKKKKTKKVKVKKEEDEYMDTDEENETVAGGYLL